MNFKSQELSSQWLFNTVKNFIYSAKLILCSAVKQLIAINHIKNKKMMYVIYVCTVYIYYVYIYIYIDTHIQHIFKKNMLRLYIKYIYIWYNLYEYKYKHAYIFKIYAVCGCLYIYIRNIHSTHIYYVNKNFFWMRLITINLLTTLILCN